jgi:glycyl-tRNA synthetase
MLLCGQNFAKAFAFSGSRPLTGAASRASRVLSSAATEEAASSATEEKETPKPQDIPNMEEIVSLCKRRGIIFPSSEIYNGYAGFFDYGPLGSELKKNLKDVWWNHFVTKREDVVGLDSSIIHNPTVWKSSGTFHRNTEFFYRRTHRISTPQRNAMIYFISS